MRYRRLGRTEYEVSEIGFGAWGIGKAMWGGGDDTRSLRALNQAVDQGLNFIDTALAYGNGHSERLIGKLLKERSERIFVATKVPPRNLRWPASGTLEEVFPREHIVKSVEWSLRHLEVETLDLVQLHVWSPDWIRDSQWYDTLSRLREAGRLGFFGVSLSDHRPDTGLELVASGKVDTVQVIYNIFDQSPEDRLFPSCLEHDVGVIARVPFDEGGLTGEVTPETSFSKKDWRNLYFKGDRKRQVYERVERLERLLGDEADSLPKLALKFCLHHRAVGTVIPGMRSEEHVRVNLEAGSEPPLSGAMVDRLRQHRWERNFYPE